MTLLERDERMRKEGYSEGHAKGLAEGHAEGLAEGHAEGLAEGHAEGLAEGHSEGLSEGLSVGLTALVHSLHRYISDPDELIDAVRENPEYADVNSNEIRELLGQMK